MLRDVNSRLGAENREKLEAVIKSFLEVDQLGDVEINNAINLPDG